MHFQDGRNIMDIPGIRVHKQRIRREPDEWRDIIRRFEQSGQTQEQFCTQHRLGLSTFNRWRQRLRHPQPAPSRGGDKALFIELEPTASVTPPLSWDVELELGGGVVLRLGRTGC
jgi:hypothetical protein